jgi:4-hydroxy-2-oxoheptanedioate aldolase
MLYQQAIRDVADAAKKHGKATGVLLRDPKEYHMYFDLGYRFLACGADGAFVTKGADEMVKQLNYCKSKT